MDDIGQGPISLRIQTISLIFIIFWTFLLLKLIKKGKLKSGYSLVWVVGTLLLFFTTIYTPPLYLFAGVVGIDYVPSAIFLVLIAGTLIMNLHFSLIISKHQRQIKKLAQEHALLAELLKRRRTQKSKKK